MQSLKSTLIDWCPPAVSRALRRALGRTLRFDGPYSNWKAALLQSSGYDEAAILERVTAATREVLAGTAAFERDGVAFTRMDYPIGLMAGLLRAALVSQPMLRVWDLGGGLGGTYRQCRALFPDELRLAWTVIEQPHYAQVGKLEFSTQELGFSDQFPRSCEPNDVIVAASVLQYLPAPRSMLSQLFDLKARYVLIDRTPFFAGDSDRLYIQRAPRTLHSTSYPCWIFSEREFLRHVEPRWRVLMRYDAAEQGFMAKDGLKIQFQGFLLERA